MLFKGTTWVLREFTGAVRHFLCWWSLPLFDSFVALLRSQKTLVYNWEGARIGRRSSFADSLVFTDGYGPCTARWWELVGATVPMGTWDRVYTHSHKALRDNRTLTPKQKHLPMGLPIFRQYVAPNNSPWPTTLSLRSVQTTFGKRCMTSCSMPPLRFPGVAGRALRCAAAGLPPSWGPPADRSAAPWAARSGTDKPEFFLARSGTVRNLRMHFPCTGLGSGLRAKGQFGVLYNFC